MRVLAFDLSLTRTGICAPDGTTWTRRWAGDPLERLDDAYRTIRDLIRLHQPTVIVCEGYAFGTAGKMVGRAFAVGELGGVARLAIRHEHRPLVVIAPSSLKVYATGDGRASKDQMLMTAMRYADRAFGAHDEADAWWLRAMMHDLGGDPLFDLPIRHRRALDQYR